MSSDDEAVKPAEHHVSLYRGSIEILKNAIRQPGWYKELPENMYEDASIIAESPMMTSQRMPRMEEGADREAWEEEVLEPWLDDPVPWRLEEWERDAFKELVKHMRKEGQLPVGKYGLCLLRQFGLSSRKPKE